MRVPSISRDLLHFVRDQVIKGSLQVSHVSFNDQVADALTKPVPVNRFLTLGGKLMVLPKPLCLQGGNRLMSRWFRYFYCFFLLVISLEIAPLYMCTL